MAGLGWGALRTPCQSQKGALSLQYVPRPKNQNDFPLRTNRVRYFLFLASVTTRSFVLYMTLVSTPAVPPCGQAVARPWAHVAHRKTSAATLPSFPKMLSTKSLPFERTCRWVGTHCRARRGSAALPGLWASVSASNLTPFFSTAIRRLPLYQRTPIMGVSANAMNTDGRWKECGMTAMYQKPVNWAELRKAVLHDVRDSFLLGCGSITDTNPSEGSQRQDIAGHEKPFTHLLKGGQSNDFSDAITSACSGPGGGSAGMARDQSTQFSDAVTSNTCSGCRASPAPQKSCSSSGHACSSPDCLIDASVARASSSINSNSFASSACPAGPSGPAAFFTGRGQYHMPGVPSSESYSAFAQSHTLAM